MTAFFSPISGLTNMDLTRLNTFSTVAKTLSFTKAARELGLTQPAVSRQIKSLEDELGKDLLLRNKNTIRLTREGEVVLAYATKLAAQVKSMRLDVINATGQSNSVIRIIASPRSLANPFPEIRKAWMQVHPEIELAFTSALESQAIVESVREGIADFGFTTYIGGFEGVEIVPWGEFDMVLVAGSSDRELSESPVELFSLLKRQWILFEVGSWVRRDSDEIFETYNFRPKRIFETNDGLVIKRMVADGAGISLLPEWGVAEELNSGELKSVPISDAKTTVEVGFVVSQNRTPELDLFVEFMRGMPMPGIRVFKEKEKNGQTSQ